MSYTLDNTFGTGGIVTTDISVFNSEGNSLLIDSNNNILLGGTANDNFAIARYTSAGVLDTTFGTSGYVITNISNNDEGNSLQIDGNNNILLGGTANDNFAIARYTSAGVLDTTFGTSGYVITDISNNDEGNSLQIYGNNNILLGGTANRDADGDFAIARYTSAGVLDTTFGTSGYVITDISNNDQGKSLQIDGNNNILLGGFAHDNFSTGDFAIARYTSAGVLDNSFGPNLNGIVIIDITGYSEGNSLLIDSNNNILIGGTANDNFAIARYTSAGVLDNSFGPNLNGIVIINISGSSGYSLQFDNNGKILLGGSNYDGNKNNFIVARYTSDGILDTTFDPNGNGYIITDIPGSDQSVAYSLKVDDSNNILLGGYFTNGQGEDKFAIARYSIGQVIPICFVGNTPILTDQGLININLIDTKKHTIDNKKIVKVTKTHTNEKYLVEIKKDALALNVPSKDTILSMEHKVLYKENMIESKNLVNKVNNVNFIKYDNQPLYNILLNSYYHVNVNNMIAETLYPITKNYKVVNPIKHKFLLHKQPIILLEKKCILINNFNIIYLLFRFLIFNFNIIYLLKVKIYFK